MNRRAALIKCLHVMSGDKFTCSVSINPTTCEWSTHEKPGHTKLWISYQAEAILSSNLHAEPRSLIELQRSPTQSLIIRKLVCNIFRKICYLFANWFRCTANKHIRWLPSKTLSKIYIYIYIWRLNWRNYWCFMELYSNISHLGELLPSSDWRQ